MEERAVTDHSNDDWYIDSGMHGIRVVVQNGGLRLNRYAPPMLAQMRFPEQAAWDFLASMDFDWKRSCKEVLL